MNNSNIEELKKAELLVNEAYKRFRLATLKTFRTADGHPLQEDVWNRTYYLVKDVWLSFPEIEKINLSPFSIEQFEMVEDKVKIWGKIYRGGGTNPYYRKEFFLNELYYTESAAKLQLKKIMGEIVCILNKEISECS